MFDSIVAFLEEYPYPGFILFMVLCGLGLPVPEEITLTAAGYISYLGKADVLLAGLSCAVGIFLGDVTPFLLGRTFGPRILRLRSVRAFVSRPSLVNFDQWFDRHGYKTILVARFIPGMRTAAFFTAGALRMKLWKFVLMDGMGIVVVTNVFVFLGYRFGAQIDSLVQTIATAEKWVLVLTLGGIGAGGLVWLALRRRKRLALLREPAETYVEPSVAPATDLDGDAGAEPTLPPEPDSPEPPPPPRDDRAEPA
jgi:membrane protein DedA with SNARE-associated domain